jgi:hypothetical protein
MVSWVIERSSIWHYPPNAMAQAQNQQFDPRQQRRLQKVCRCFVKSFCVAVGLRMKQKKIYSMWESLGELLAILNV